MNGIGRGDKDQNTKEKSAIFSRETAGMVLLLFSALLLLFVAAGPFLFGEIGLAVASFFIGLCGFFSYPLFVFGIYEGIVLVSGKKFLNCRWLLRGALVLVSIFLIVHTATAERFYLDPQTSEAAGFGAYLAGCWGAASEAISAGTGGGVLFGLVAYPVRLLLSEPGAYIIYAVLTLLSVFFFLLLTPVKDKLRPVERRPREKREKRSISFGDLDARPRSARGEHLDEDAVPTPATQAFGARTDHPYARQTGPDAQQGPYSWPGTGSYSQQGPYSQPGTGTQPPRPQTAAQSRDILFRGDPAASYRANLIYSSDSAFNRNARRSTIQPVDPSYSDAFSRDAEQARDAMPKRVTTDEFNYPERPSYRAPDPVPPAPPAPAPAPAPAVEPELPKPSYQAQPEPPKPADTARRSDMPPFDPFGGSDMPPTDRRRSDMPPASTQEGQGATGRRTLRVGFGDADEPAARDFPAPDANATGMGFDFRRHDGRGETADPRSRDFGLDSDSRRGDPFTDSRRDDTRGSNDFGLDTDSRRGDPFTDSRRDDTRGSNDYGLDSDSRRGDPFTDSRRDDARGSNDYGLDSDSRRGDPFTDPRRDDTRGSNDYGLDSDSRRGDPFTDSRRDDARGSNDFGLDSDSRRGDPFTDSRRDDARGSNDFGLDTDSRMGDPFTDPRRDDSRGEDFGAEGRASSLLDGDDPLPADLTRGERAIRDAAPAPEPEKPAPKKKKHVWKRYKRPDVGLLRDYEDRVILSNEDTMRNQGIILDTLRRYKIETQIIGVKSGASVTRYDLAMPENTTISSITRYDDELSLYLMVKGVNMYANPDVRGISVEVPNAKRATVGLKSLILSEEFAKNDPEALLFALGQDVEGRPIIGNVTAMTHILVAGMTGSGKSVAIHAMLISMLFKYSPEELRLILIDPKQSEFTLYEGIPHLMINEIITQPAKAVTALSWAVKEMERRYTLFNEKTRSGIAVSKLDEYNQNLTEGEERLPKIIIVVDEFADLMMTAKKEVEERIQRLAQKARAAGIHLILATQRPDATVVTGVIKSNLPTRIALSVDSDLNSRIMIDDSGAEKLLGNGDMLIKTAGKPKRAQGAFISTPERQRVIAFIRENNETYFDEEVSDFINKQEEEAPDAPAAGGGSTDAVSDIYIRALAVVIKAQKASISLLQRKLNVGYNHAGKIIEWMESMKYISAFDGAKMRTVYLTKEEFEEKYGSIDE